MGVRRGRASRGLGGVSGSGGAMRLGSPWGGVVLGLGGGVFGTGGSMGLEGGFRGAELSSRWRVPSGWGGPWGCGGHWDSGGFIWFGIGGSVGPGTLCGWGVRGAGGIRGTRGSLGVRGSSHIRPHTCRIWETQRRPPGPRSHQCLSFPSGAEPPRDPSPPTGGGNPRWGRPRETAAPLPMGRIRAAGTARPRYAAEGPLHW